MSILPALTLSLLAILTPPLPTPADETAYIDMDKGSKTHGVGFDSNGTDINGNPIVLKRAEFIFRVHPFPTPPPADIVVPTKDSPKNLPETNVYMANVFLASVPAGKYQLTVRFVSGTDVVGGESNPIYLNVTDEKKPAAPLNLRQRGAPSG